ncbi:uncharacterized protein LOC129749767 [Uranotaenia lowii]|uniref:uncharacterized protein LOC129749767 n=1 Tax=Uranotaenia lowii TaxID=190385 RepID=UPI0024795A8C|nr:uncharacterized protein LOC129749767 [Uranotaenia lowii]
MQTTFFTWETTRSNQPQKSHRRDPCDDALFWEILKRNIQIVAFQHGQLLKMYYKVKQLVERSFLLCYLYALVIWSLLLFEILKDGLSMLTFISCGAMLGSIMNTISCCWFVDAFHEMHDNLALTIFGLMTEIPYSAKYRRDYTQVRSTLLMMHQNATRGPILTCGGLFIIELTVITRLVQKTYTFVAFLFDVI